MFSPLPVYHPRRYDGEAIMVMHCRLHTHCWEEMQSYRGVGLFWIKMVSNLRESRWIRDGGILPKRPHKTCREWDCAGWSRYKWASLNFLFCCNVPFVPNWDPTPRKKAPSSKITLVIVGGFTGFLSQQTHKLHCRLENMMRHSRVSFYLWHSCSFFPLADASPPTRDDVAQPCEPMTTFFLRPRNIDFSFLKHCCTFESGPTPNGTCGHALMRAHTHRGRDLEQRGPLTVQIKHFLAANVTPAVTSAQNEVRKISWK